MSNTLIKLLEEFPDKPWDVFWRLSDNPNITIDFVLNNFDFDSNRGLLTGWSWYSLSQNEAITLEHVLKHPEVSKITMDLELFKL